MTDDSTAEPADVHAKRLLNKREAAHYLGISVRYLEHSTAQGTMPGYCPLGSRMPRWDRVILDRWIAAKCPRCSDEEFLAATADQSGKHGPG